MKKLSISVLVFFALCLNAFAFPHYPPDSGKINPVNISAADYAATFPAGAKGQFFNLTSSGWLGGAAGAGLYVNAGDLIYCNTDTVADTYTAVEAYWNHYQRVISQPDGYRSVEIANNIATAPAITNGFYWLNNVMYKVENSTATKSIGVSDLLVPPPIGTTTPAIGRFGAAGNYTDIAATGKITLVGTAKCNNIINLGIDGLSQGGTAPSVVKLANFYGFGFTINDIGYVRAFEMPYDWDGTTSPILKIHWYINEAYTAESGEVRWNALYNAIVETGAVVDPATETLDFGDINIPATAKHLIESSATIPVATIGVEKVIGMQIKRVGLVAGDNPTAEPVIVGIELEYVTNKLGE